MARTIAANLSHIDCFYCYGNVDANSVWAFQQHPSEEAAPEFPNRDACVAYLSEVGPLVASLAKVTTRTPLCEVRNRRFAGKLMHLPGKAYQTAR
jgi:hypothetical protein